MLPEVSSLSQPDSNMVDMNVHAESPNKASWGMLLLSRYSRLPEEGSHPLQRADHVANITLKELIGAEEGRGSEFTVPEVRVGRDVSAIQDDGQRGGFHRVFISGGLGDVQRLYAVATCRLRHWESKVGCPDWAILDQGDRFIVFFNVHVVL